jgi:hypothetical protein
MPYVEGESLRDHLTRERQLPVGTPHERSHRTARRSVPPPRASTGSTAS